MKRTLGRVLLGLIAVAPSCTGLEVDLYPLYRAGPVDEQGTWAWEALGPFLYGEAGPRGNRVRWGLRPLLAVARSPERRLLEVLWPLGRFLREAEGGWRDRFAPFYWAWGDGLEAHVRFYPLFFLDRGPRPGFAFWPLCGDLRDFLGMDRFRFVLFPLYARSDTGHHVLWPLFGAGEGWLRVLPWYARRRTARAEGLTLLWPLYTQFRRGPLKGFHLWPLYGRWAGPEAEGWTTLYPLVRIMRDTRRGRGEVHGPFPFFERWWSRRGEGLRVWPLFGAWRSRDGSFESRFFLWPIVWARQERTGGGARGWDLRVLPFFTYRRQGERAWELYLWPLWEERRRRDGSALTAALPVLPWRAVSEPAHAHWGLFLSPYLRRQDREGRVRVQSWLGLFRAWYAPGFERWSVPFLWSHRRSAAGRLEQFLGGLIRWEESARGGTVLRVLGFPIRLARPAEGARP